VPHQETPVCLAPAQRIEGPVLVLVVLWRAVICVCCVAVLNKVVVVTNLFNVISPGGGGTVGGGNRDEDGLLLDFHGFLPRPTTT
jgi:hypothetical protein